MLHEPSYCGTHCSLGDRHRSACFSAAGITPLSEVALFPTSHWPIRHCQNCLNYLCAFYRRSRLQGSPNNPHFALPLIQSREPPDATRIDSPLASAAVAGRPTPSPIGRICKIMRLGMSCFLCSDCIDDIGTVCLNLLCHTADLKNVPVRFVHSPSSCSCCTMQSDTSASVQYLSIHIVCLRLLQTFLRIHRSAVLRAAHSTRCWDQACQSCYWRWTIADARACLSERRYA